MVLSPRAYNEKTNLMVCCPMTTQIKNYPFEVQIANTTPSSVVLADQIRSLDWRLRRATRKGGLGSLCNPYYLDHFDARLRFLTKLLQLFL